MTYLPQLRAFNERAANRHIQAAREALRGKRYVDAAKHALKAQRLAPHRHEGWRLRIEALAKARGRINRAVEAYRAAEAAQRLDDRARVLQALHLIKGVVRYIGPASGSHTASGTPLVNAVRTSQEADQAAGAIADLLRRDDLPISAHDAESAGRLFAETHSKDLENDEKIIPALVDAATARLRFDPNLPEGLNTTAGLQFQFGVLSWGKLQPTEGAGNLARTLIGALPGLNDRYVARAVSEPTAGPRSRSGGKAVSQTQWENLLGRPAHRAQAALRLFHRLRTGRLALTADRHFASGRHSDALPLYVRKLAADPADRRTLDRIVKCLEALAPPDAGDRLERLAGPVFARVPDNEKHLHELAKGVATLRKEGRHLKTPARLQAEDFLDAALRRNPKDVSLWSERAHIHLSRREFDLAWEALRGLESRCPSAPELPLLKCVAARMRGDLDDAVQFGRQATEHAAANRFAPHLKLADALTARGQLAAAERTMSAVADLNPGNGEIRKKLADVLTNIGALAAATRYGGKTEMSGSGTPTDVAQFVIRAGTGEAPAPDESGHGDDVLTLDTPVRLLIERLEDTPAGVVVVTTHKFTPEDIDALIAERRQAIGLTYAAAPDPESRRSVPDVSAAWAVSLAHADLLMIARDVKVSTVADALQKSADVLAEQYVPLTAPQSREQLRLKARQTAPDAVLQSASLTSKVRLPDGIRTRRLAKDADRTDFFDHPRCPVLLSWQDLDRSAPWLDLAAPVILSLHGLTEKKRCAIAEDDALRAHWRQQIAAASAVIVTDLDVAEWLEDHFAHAVFVNPSPEAGIERALAFLKHRFVVKIGAGIGNILQATPLIRWLSDRLAAPVDVCISSGVASAHELFGESRFVNVAYHAGDVFAGRRYDSAFVASTMGATARGALADQVFIQRSVYDFYATTRTLSEARYHFEGIWHLIGSPAAVDGIELSPFVRGFDVPPERTLEPKDVAGARVGMAGGKRDDLWRKRRWPHFDELAAQLMDLGVEVHSMGVSGEAIPGCVDHTDARLRDSVRLVREMDAFVGPDGGLFHIADALQIPTAVIFGPTSVVKNGPIATTSSVIRSDRSCAPCQFREEFTSCGSPLCMTDVTVSVVKERVLDKLRNGGRSGAGTPAEAIRLEIGNRGVLAREAYLPEFLAQSCSLYEFVDPAWDYVFTAIMGNKRLERARQLLNWRMTAHDIDDAVRYARARLSYVARDYDDCISYCQQDDGKVERPWLLRNNLLRSLTARQQWKQIATLWEQLDGTNSDGIESDARAWAESAIPALRAFAILGEEEKLDTLRRKVASTSIHIKDFTDLTAQLDDSPYRLPGTRFASEGGAGLKLALVDEWTDRPKELAGYNPDLEVYALKRDELTPGNIEDMDLLLIPQKTVSPAEGIALPDGFAEIGAEPGSDGGSWRLFGRAGSECARKPTALGEWLRANGEVAQPARRKRIMVVAHHHLEKHNPRGGERSTAAILKQLKADGYETIVIIENKKTKSSGLDETALSKYVICGQYAFDSTLRAAIACWRPDGVVTYGMAGLVAGRVCTQMGVPYVMFPRDWSEVCPKPHRDLELRPRVVNDDNPFRRVYANAFKIVTNAEYVGRVIAKLYDANSVTSYVPVFPPPEDFEPVALGERTEILLINASKWNGGDLVRELASRRTDLHFRVIGGDGKPFPPNVRVDPFFNGRHYCDMYRNARLFLFPLGEEDPCGTGRVIFEALMCHTPCLSFDRGGMKEVLPDKWLLRENTTDAWLSAISRILDDNPEPHEFDSLTDRFDYRDQLAVIDAAIASMCR